MYAKPYAVVYQLIKRFFYAVHNCSSAGLAEQKKEREKSKNLTLAQRVVAGLQPAASWFGRSACRLSVGHRRDTLTQCFGLVCCGQSVSHSLWHNSRARISGRTGNQNLITVRACVGSLGECVQNYRLKYWPAISLARASVWNHTVDLRGGCEWISVIFKADQQRIVK